MDRPSFFKDEYLTDVLSSYDIAPDEIEFYIKTDLSEPTMYGSTYVIALSDSLCVVRSDKSFFRKFYNEITDIFALNYVSSGELIVKTENGEYSLACFTMSFSSEIAKFIGKVRRKIDGNLLDYNTEESTSNKFSYINNGRKKLFFRLLSYLPRYKKHLFIMTIIIFMSTFLNLIPPYLTGTVLYDEVLSKNGEFYGEIFPLVSILIGLMFLSVLLSIFLGRVGAELSGRIIYDIKTEVFSSMQKLGVSFFTSKRTGNLLNRVNSDALDIQYFLNDGLPAFIINGATICAVGLVLFIVNPMLSVSVLIPVPLIALIIKKYARKFKKLKWHTWRFSSSLNSAINDSLSGVRVVKAFGKEENEINRFNKKSSSLYENKIREGVASAKVFPLLSFIMTVGGLLVWAIGGTQVLGGDLSFGELMSFVGYLSLLYTPVSFMVKTFDWWTSCMNSAQRIFEVIDREPDIKDCESPLFVDRLNGEIELRNVNFSYEPNRPVLKNISFTVNKGEMIGLVGHSGAGKSTITNLITRLYDVDEGEVLIDGVNVKDISISCLHKNIGIVLQNTYLFSGTIAENIAYAKPSASFEEIVDAAKKAYAHEFIITLPEGYETLIGKNGNDLSGGEKQRISIARAILMDPAILIFDEATSSLDTKTEQKIQEAMKNLTENRTTIAIAHRFSTLKHADRLVVIENGEIVETGTHDELIAKENGVYNKLASIQMNALSFGKD